MASNPQHTPAQPGQMPLLETLTANRRALAIGLLVVGAALAAIPITCIALYGWASAREIIVWGASLSIISLGAGAAAFLVIQPRQGITEVEQVRFLLLTWGGLVGFCTAVLGLLLPFSSYSAIFTSATSEWGKHPKEVWGCAAAAFGGLTIMFVSLLMARSMERSSALMRRLVYGFNAFLSSFLLLAVLLLINDFAYTRLPVFGALNQTYDWTASGVYTLSPATQSQMAALKEPVKVLVLLPGGSEVRSALLTMLENCQAYTNQITWQTFSPEVMDPDERAALRAKYDVPQDMFGMVVIYGTEPKTASTFVKESEIYTDQSGASPFDQDPSSKKKFTFKGEAALAAAIDYLEGGKSKPVVYFTQGDNELAFSAEMGEDPNGGGMGILIDNLGRGNYDLRPLKIGPETHEIPADASIVVIARPRTPLPEAAVGALRTFLKGADGKRGKLIAMLNASGPANSPQANGGLDGLLGEYNVHLGHDRILSLGLARAPATRLIAVADPRGGNPVARRFAEQGDTFMMDNVQTVQAAPSNPQFKTDSLLVTLPQLLVWTETDFRADPTAAALEAKKEFEQRKFDRFSKTPLPVAVAVSEAKADAPPIPGHEFMAQGGQPVLAVFGDAGWINDASLQGPTGEENYSLFKSTVDWMREKSTIGAQIKTKSGTEREQFSFEKITPAGAWSLEWAPAIVMLVSIVALGLGVTLVRRR